MINKYIAILAGGKGERLWPLSRNQRPKQLLPFINKKSLLEHTIDRVEGLVPANRVMIITNIEQQSAIKECVTNSSISLLCEPASRNTAPAILLTCLRLYNTDPSAHITFMPADHYIPNGQLFKKYLEQLLSNETEKIQLVGIKPPYPAIAYGYIEFDSSNQNNSLFYPVTRFHEKPVFQKAQEYCLQNNFLWNIGIFSGLVTTFINEFKILFPELFEIVNASVSQESNYHNCPNISFDHAILEKSDKCSVMPVSLDWSDVGNLDTFLSYTNKNSDKILEVNAHNNIINTSEKLIALIGVDDLCIVQTEDVLLIAKRNDVEQVKKAVHALKILNKEQYL